jgi:hypothetical protein
MITCFNILIVYFYIVFISMCIKTSYKKTLQDQKVMNRPNYKSRNHYELLKMGKYNNKMAIMSHMLDFVLHLQKIMFAKWYLCSLR